jgi:hypothetical protein
MSSPSTACPSCGIPGAGRFCSSCGAAREGTTCAGCGNPVPPTAQFCSYCGSPVAGAAIASGDRTPWLVAGVAFAGLLAVLLLLLIRRSPGPPAPPEIAVDPSGEVAGAPPDISNMSPRERFNRLYNRVMTAAQSGDEATVARFTPMALMAYAQLDTVDADARYHLALLKVHTGDVKTSRALADTILAQTPGHLFGYMVLGTVARFRKDEAGLSRAYAGFLKRYDAEMKLNRPEYAEHRTSLDDFRKAALAAK